MKNAKTITIYSGMKEVTLNIRTILYILIQNGVAYIHLSSGEVLGSRTTLAEYEEMLGDNFIKVKRGCLVSVFAIHNITDKVNLCNGETLEYAQRNQREIVREFQLKQEAIVHSFAERDVLKTAEAYREHYRVFDDLPFAFTDIEMVFDEKLRAVDWVFCYGNNALAELEGIPLDRLIGSTFRAIFPNMDAKWLRTYERATLFEEMLTIVDHSPEINANLSIICFPTFKGHCGCILLNVDELNFFRKTSDTDNAIAAFIGKLLG